MLICVYPVKVGGCLSLHTQVAYVHVYAEKHEPFIDEDVAIMLHVEKQVAG